MTIVNHINNLENLAKELTKELSVSLASFAFGEVFSSVARKSSELCPYSKVAVLFSPNGFSSFGEKAKKELKSKGLSPVCIILTDQDKDKAEIISSLPENIRLILTFERGLAFLTQEIASLLNVECVIGLSSYKEKLFLEQESAPTHFVLSNEIQVSPSAIYQNIVSKIISLLDVKLKQFLKIIDKNDYFTDKYIKILQSALLISPEQEKNLAFKLIECDLSLQLIERAFSHYFLPCDIKTSLCILRLVASYLDKDFLCVPNYIERASKVSELYNRDYFETLKCFAYQIERFKLSKDNEIHIKRGLMELANEYSLLIPKIVSTFNALGGKSNAPLKDVLFSVKYRSDIEKHNNVCSLLRENGCLEQII